MTYRIIHYLHIPNGNICLEKYASGVDLGVKMTKLEFTPQATTAGEFACKYRPILNP